MTHKKAFAEEDTMEKVAIERESEPVLNHLKVFWGGVDGSRDEAEPFRLGGGCGACVAQGGGDSGDETPPCGDCQTGGGGSDGCP